jgi:hypothetical protein
MPSHYVRHVDGRRTSRWTGIHDLKNSLEIAIQINDRSSVADKLERLVSLVPPPVSRAKRKGGGFTRPRLDPLPVDDRSQTPPLHLALLMLFQVDVKRRTLALGRE